MSDNCSVGLLPVEHPTDVKNAIFQAESCGYDFVVTPITNPSFKRVLARDQMSEEEHCLWKDRPVFQRDDLLLKSAEYSGKVLGLFSDWLDLDSTDPFVRTCSELAFRQEAEWANHINLTGVIFPPLTNEVHNTARVLNSISVSPHICIRVPLLDSSRINDNVSWKRWNKLRTLTHHTKLNVALEITRTLPTEDRLQDMWVAEPVRALIIPSDIFVINAKGQPVLSKPHQKLVNALMSKNEPDIIITGVTDDLAYAEYLRYLNRRLPEEEHVGYSDTLQMPLQPLADNLENHTYEVFEKDPVKYEQYERAVYHALLDRVDHKSEEITTIMVVGAGRGPLVDCCLRASTKSERRIHVYALEKNPNAYVTLQNAKAERWGNKVTLIFADMRKWTPERKCDILVSELLGSFGDNELSPECLDGAQKFLKDDGISIPSSYTSFIAPLASNRLYNQVQIYNKLSGFETPYVVMFKQACLLAPPDDLWTFKHPNRDVPTDPLNNLHNQRYNHTQFAIEHDMLMHGIAGYFECTLYNHINLSIHPDTHSPNMFSWFPIFFPLQQPIQVCKDSLVTVHFWRLTDQHKVWYEWSVVVNNVNGDEVFVSPIHNPAGRSYFVGL